jgi:deoxyribodipyrimidine photolyase-related protein
VITVVVVGDQLNRAIGALAEARPDTHRVLIVESSRKIASRPWHVQRAHFIVASMRRFAGELRTEGFDIDYRCADTMRLGIEEHRAEHAPTSIVATEPNSHDARVMLADLGVVTVRSNQFLCHPDDFATFAATKKSFKMEDFYRWQRKRLGYLMDGDAPVGGAWNFDADNRLPPPKTGHDRWAVPLVDALDDLDREVLDSLPNSCWGDAPTGLWATSRTGALARLRHFVDHVLPDFGPHEDAMLTDNWHLAHSLLSPYLNNGLLLPSEVCDEVQRAYDRGRVPINSAEGFIRQIIGWREFIWNTYWREMPGYRERNHLDAVRPLPPMFTSGNTKMRCMAATLEGVRERAWVHHIPRLMVLGNFALLSGIEPLAFTRWMWNSFVDAAEWVMLPNVVGMSLYADGGVIATKPYAAGGAYIDRMSDHCKGCAFDRKKRTGDDACPFTTLYWDFLARHADRFVRNPRIVTQVRAAQKLADLDDVRATAAGVLRGVDTGRI